MTKPPVGGVQLFPILNSKFEEPEVTTMSSPRSSSQNVKYSTLRAPPLKKPTPPKKPNHNKDSLLSVAIVAAEDNVDEEGAKLQHVR